jgi:hypothetical protein
MTHGNESLEFAREVSVVIICRLLFDPPSEGWGELMLGTTPSMINRDAISEFPQFPFVVIDGVPIMLVEYFDANGPGFEPDATLLRVQSLEVTTRNLKTENYDGATRLLVGSDRFRRLYPDIAQREHMGQVIFQRAR